MSDTEREASQPTRITPFRRRPCPECGEQMRCHPGYVEGRVMLTWRCPEHGYWTDEPRSEQEGMP